MSAAVLLATTLLYTYTVLGEDGRAVARAITDDEHCPAIVIDAGAPVAMSVRAGKADIPVRKGPQADAKAASFPVLACEHEVPAGARTARIGGTSLPLPSAQPRRILVIGDTGCRMKASDDAWQKCDDEEWPLEALSKTAAAMKPDLIVHLGDMHYRESPCATGAASCTQGPWGYGFDAWEADFFKPVASLLHAAPWIMVRGNHEICARAGQGWFRFLDPRKFAADSSCDAPALDSTGDFSAPYAVPLGRGLQFIVFDSSHMPHRPYARANAAFKRYVGEMRQVDALAARAASSIFLSHHPVLGMSTAPGGTPEPGNAALQQVMASIHPGGLFPKQVSLAIHGHVHIFQALSFGAGFPAAIVVGNSGSQRYDPIRVSLAGFETAPGARITRSAVHGRFGFLMMEREADRWRFTAHDGYGMPIFRCRLAGRDLRCDAPPPPFD